MRLHCECVCEFYISLCAKKLKFTCIKHFLQRHFQAQYSRGLLRDEIPLLQRNTRKRKKDSSRMTSYFASLVVCARYFIDIDIYFIDLIGLLRFTFPHTSMIHQSVSQRLVVFTLALRPLSLYLSQKLTQALFALLLLYELFYLRGLEFGVRRCAFVLVQRSLNGCA